MKAGRREFVGLVENREGDVGPPSLSNLQHRQSKRIIPNGRKRPFDVDMNEALL